MIVDIKARPKTSIQMHTSNLGHVERRPGGVAFNIAAGLARLGCWPYFISILGKDADSEYMLAQAGRRGIATNLVSATAAEPTAMYVAVLDEHGDQLVGVASTALLERVTPTFLAYHEALIRSAPLVIADNNLPRDTMTWLRELCKAHSLPLWVEPTAADKCDRLRGNLDGVTWLSPNVEELEAIVERRLETREQVIEAARELIAQGVGTVFVTLGEEGLVHVTADAADAYPSAPVVVVDVIGAGDAFVAGTVWALLRKRATPEAIRCGIATSLVIIQNLDAAPPHLEPELVEDTVRLLLTPRHEERGA